MATRRGCDNQKVARAIFVKEMFRSNETFQVRDSGLIINPDVPHLGASPDGLVSCDCCGGGCLEIKCPLCKKDHEGGSNRKFYLQKDDDGKCYPHQKPYCIVVLVRRPCLFSGHEVC